MSYPLLENAPLQDTPEFIEYLREYNPVVWEDSNWLVIENCKYHTKERPFYTAFAKDNTAPLNDLYSLWDEFGEHEWRKKAVVKQTVLDRFHIHIIPKA